MACEKLRVLDLTWVLAGPGAVRYLADHGAQVIKVERQIIGDIGRHVLAFKDDERGINRSGYYNNINRGKLSITLNLADPRGVEVIKDLVRISDVVFENFSSGVLERRDLHYEALKEIKPDIIMVSMSAAGHSGPYKDYVSFGPTLQALSGITYLTGFPDRDPVGFGYSYSDFTGGWGGVIPVLAALHHRNKTGEGQWIDAGQLIPLIALLGPGLLDYSVNKRGATRLGNRLPWGYGAPHGAYPCQGDDRWCVISVFNDREWQGFSEAIGNPAWTRDERFATAASRAGNADELDRLVAEWTKERTDQEVMEVMQKHGVAAGVVQNAQDLIERDPQMKHRGFFVYLEHPEVGMLGHEGVTFKLSETPGSLRRAPLLGEYNDFVYGEILGMSKETIEHYTAEGVF
jgi:crotonobetainyl-CoA:carnitine CoA-transferase CaiB-like acyl-CoA transferase